MRQDISSLDKLYEVFDGLHMEGGWHRKRPALWPEPARNFLPWQWKYSDVKPVLDSAGRLIGTDKAERRNLTMRNPVDGNPYSTVRTLVAAYQMIKPGETARSHRHTPNALRLILEGRGTFTVVNGHRVEMRPGDVLLTPNWAWHSHDNEGPDDCYWMDFLDVPLVHLLEPMFYEPHPDGTEKKVVLTEESPLAFRWEETEKKLARAREKNPEAAMVSVELGSPALATVGLEMQSIRPGGLTGTSQTTANSIYAVVRGSGLSEIDGETFNWSFGDTLCVPAWRPFRHESKEGAVLLRVTDAPLLEKLGWLRSCSG